jgi:hypothetical protein
MKYGPGVLSRTVAPAAYFWGSPHGCPMTKTLAALPILPLVRTATGARPFTARSSRTTAQSVPSALSRRPINVLPAYTSSAPNLVRGVVASCMRKPKTNRMRARSAAFVTQWPAVTMTSVATRNPEQKHPIGWETNGSLPQRSYERWYDSVSRANVPSAFFVRSLALTSATTASAARRIEAAVT